MAPGGITGHRQSELEQARKPIGRNVTAVQGDVADLDDLDCLYQTVSAEKGVVDIDCANARCVELPTIDAVRPAAFAESTPLVASGAPAQAAVSRAADSRLRESTRALASACSLGA